MTLVVDRVESDLKTYFDDYWSLFFMSGESDSTSHEWARSQMIEVSEALFWVAFEKPKKITTVDRFVIREWLERIRAGREYYESKEDLLLLLAFGCKWEPDRICDALKISKSTFYFRLFQAIRLRSSLFRRNSGHLGADCAHFDLRIPEYLVSKNSGLASEEPISASLKNMVEGHAETCRRCMTLKTFAFDLAQSVQQTWNQHAPEAVLNESLHPFVEARNNPIKKNFWTRMPPLARTILAVSVVAALAYFAFRRSASL